MPSPEATRRLMSLGLLALPIAAVKLASLMIGIPSAKATASASAVATPAAGDSGNAAATPRVEWTKEQRAAAEHVRQLAASGFGPAPMLYVASPEVQIAIEDPVPEILAPTIPQPPRFTLQAVMAAVTGDSAVINGRMYSVGQTIEGTDWEVQEIDVSRRKAVLFDSEYDRTVTIAVQTPG